MNEYDTNRIFDTVREIGFVKTENLEESNCYLLNTCHIRDKAKEKVYHEIGRVKKNFRSRKKPIVIVAGCVAQAENEEMMKREPYIDMVIGPQAYHKINDTIQKLLDNKKKIEETEFDAKRLDRTGYEVLKTERDVLIGELRGLGVNIMDWEPDMLLSTALAGARGF